MGRSLLPGQSSPGQGPNASASQPRSPVVRSQLHLPPLPPDSAVLSMNVPPLPRRPSLHLNMAIHAFVHSLVHKQPLRVHPGPGRPWCWDMVPGWLWRPALGLGLMSSSSVLQMVLGKQGEGSRGQKAVRPGLCLSCPAVMGRSPRLSATHAICKVGTHSLSLALPRPGQVAWDRQRCPWEPRFLHILKSIVPPIPCLPIPGLGFRG